MKMKAKNKLAHSRFLSVIISLFVIAVSGLSATFAWENFNQRSFNATYEDFNYIDIEVEKRIVREEGENEVLVLPGAEFALEQWIASDCDDEDEVECGFDWYPLTFDLTGAGPTFTTDEHGRFTLSLSPGWYRLVEVGVPSGFELIANNPYTVFEVVINDAGHVEVLFEGEVVDLIAVYNERLYDELAVDKIVVNEDGSELTDAQRNQLFTFDVELRYDGRVLPAPQPYTVYRLIFDEAGNVIGVGEQLRTGLTTNTGLFQLRHGERAVFRDIPVGTDFEVNETMPTGFNVTKSGSRGVIADQRNADELLNHVVVVNEMRRDPDLPDDGYIVVEKSVIGQLDPDRHPTCFWFTIIIGDYEPYRTCIAPGGSWTSNRFPVGTPFSVTEDDYSHLGIISVPGRINGQIITGRHTISFSNIVQPEDGGDDGEGDLEISKRVVGEGFDPEKEFTFFVTLNGFTTLPVEIRVYRNDDFYELITVVESPETNQWAGFFDLRAGERITLRNIPAGVNFTVSELYAEDYVPGVINFDGVIARDHTSVARFTNEYRPGDPGLPPEDGELDVCKVLTDLSDAPDVFFYFELHVDDEFYASFVLQANECLSDTHRGTFTLPIGTEFRVIEPADQIPNGFVFRRSFGEAGTIQVSNQAIFINDREYVEIPVEKLWNFNGQELVLPEYIVVYLLANGRIVQVAQISPDDYGNWQHTFRVRRADAQGDIVYTVVERPVPGWTKIITNNETEAGFIITNNAFIPEEGDEVEVEKILIGDPAFDHEFWFTITPVTVGAPTPNPNRISITGEGTEAFGRITFTEPGVFEYLVREVIPADQGDFNFDVRVYVVTFTVTSDDNGRLTVVGPDITLDGQVVSHIEFVNEYAPCEDCEECDTVDFIFTKVNANGTTPLAGATFNLYARNDEDTDWVTPAIQTNISMANGRVIFTELTFGGRYRLVETSAPDGFIMPTGYWIVNVSDDGVITVTAHGTNQPEFVNNNVVTNIPIETEPRTVDFEFTKVNVNGTTPLAGAEFSLYARNDDDTDWVTPAIQTNISMANGRVVFTGLTYGSQYRLRETSAPDGFITPAGYWIVAVSATGEITVTSYGDDQPAFINNNVVTNTPVAQPGTVNFEFTKINASGGTPLAGANFSLYARNNDDTDWVTPAIQTNLSATNGRVIFTGLTYGSRYRLRETSAPDGFITPIGYWIVTVSSTGEITVTAYGDDQPEFTNNNVVANIPTETASETVDFEFTKINANGGTPLAGATFSLYARNADNTDWVTPAIQSITSNNNGSVVFTGLTHGSQYRLRETSAPTGFITPTGYWIVTVSVTGDITVTTHGTGQPAFINNNVVTNTPVTTQPGTVNFEFTKVNANGGTPLADATFSLYARNAAGTGWVIPAIQTNVSATNGRVVFTGLTYGSQYRLRETSAPSGFVTPTGYWIVTVSATGEITVTTYGTNQPAFINNSVVANTPVTTQPGTVNFEFTKVNASGGTPLAGANFSLYARNAANTGWVTPAIQTNVSATNGRVVFTGLTYGSQYRLRETSAPTGFITPTGYWIVTVSSTGEITVTTHGTNQPAFINNNVVTNTPVATQPGTVNFEFTKVNANGGTPLAGANFSLYTRNAANTGWVTPAIQTNVSAINGRVVFTGLTYGSQYRLRETSAPTGFITPTGYWIVTVSSTGEITVTAHGTNQPAFVNNNVVTNTQQATGPGGPGGNQPGGPGGNEPGGPGGPGGNQPGGPGGPGGPSGNQPPAQSRPPQTSDEGMMQFWITMTVVSGSLLIVYASLSAYFKYRKTEQ